jgi:Helix-turn-helix domain
MSKQILEEVAYESTPLPPRWLRLPVAIRYSGISRSKLYELFTEGQIKAASVHGKGSKRGIRLVDRLSLDAYLEQAS